MRREHESPVVVHRPQTFPRRVPGGSLTAVGPRTLHRPPVSSGSAVSASGKRRATRMLLPEGCWCCLWTRGPGTLWGPWQGRGSRLCCARVAPGAALRESGRQDPRSQASAGWWACRGLQGIQCPGLLSTQPMSRAPGTSAGRVGSGVTCRVSALGSVEQEPGIRSAYRCCDSADSAQAPDPVLRRARALSWPGVLPSPGIHRSSAVRGAVGRAWSRSEARRDCVSLS